MSNALGKVAFKTINDTPKLKKRVGKRFSILNSDWATQASNWSNVGSPNSTMVFNPNYATISGGDSGLLMAHLYTPFKTVSRRVTVRTKVQCINGSMASQYGLVCHLYSANTSAKSSFSCQIANEPSDVASGRVTFFLNQLTANKNNGNAKLPPTNPMDIFEVTMTVDQTAVYMKYNNLTQGAIISHVFRWDSQAYNPVNMWQFGFSCFGGAWNILELDCVDNELVNPDLIFIGDSLTSGVTGVGNMKTGKDFPAIIANRFPSYSVTRWSGGGDSVNMYSETKALNELLLRKPKYAFLLMGLNDIGLFARTLAQLQVDYATLVSTLKANGTTIIHGGLLPNNVRDTRPFNSWVKATYSNEFNIDMFSPLADTNVCSLQSGSASFGMNSAWLADTNTHINEAGDFRLADCISVFLVENNIFNPSQMLNQVP